MIGQGDQLLRQQKSVQIHVGVNEIFNDVLLSLVQPTSNGEDEKRKWIETGSHPQAYHGRLF